MKKMVNSLKPAKMQWFEFMAIPGKLSQQLACEIWKEFKVLSNCKFISDILMRLNKYNQFIKPRKQRPGPV